MRYSLTYHASVNLSLVSGGDPPYVELVSLLDCSYAVIRNSLILLAPACACCNLSCNFQNII